jgi:hypothetical protein
VRQRLPFAETGLKLTLLLALSVSGLALLEALSKTSSSEWTKIIAVSRRPPVLEHKDPRIEFVSVDLLAGREEIITSLRKAGAENATQ